MIKMKIQPAKITRKRAIAMLVTAKSVHLHFQMAQKSKDDVVFVHRAQKNFVEDTHPQDAKNAQNTMFFGS